MTTCTIAADGRSITCLTCMRTSHHSEDVRNRYCGHCHAFHDPEPGKLIGCALYVIKPGDTEAAIAPGRSSIANVRLPETPSLADMRAVVMPHLAGAEYMEHVSVLFQDKAADMFVDEIGILKGLPRNELATAIYRTFWLRDHRVDPDSLPHIAGVAVIFGRKVWS